MSATNSGVSVTVLLLVLCLGLAMIFVGGWYFQSSLVELKEQQQETAQIVQQLKEKVRKQSKQLNELRLQLEMRQFKVSINSSSYNLVLTTKRLLVDCRMMISLLRKLLIITLLLSIPV